MNYQDIYDFWFTELTPNDWFSVNDALDKTINNKFKVILDAAIAGELHHWRSTAMGSLCEIIVLDQFSRNIFRGQAQAFRQDPLALALAQTAIDKGFDKQLNETEVGFMYLPFMHSESAKIHELAMMLYKDHPSYEFEAAHKSIIDQFGRYPHRNAILGRKSTEQELTFLTQPNSSF